MNRILLFLAASVGVVFLIGPLVIVVGGSVSDSPFVQFPPEGFTLRWYAEMMKRDDFLASFVDSVIIAVLTTAAAAVMGTLAALGMQLFGSPRLREALATFVLSPLVLPTIITGVALFQAVRWIDVDLPYATLVVGHTLITVPYVVRTVGAALVSLDQSILEAAESLGASPARVILQVLVPAIAPAIFVSLIFVFIVSFDQVTVSLFLSSPDVTPLPIRIYNYIEFAIDPMIAAVSTTLIVFAYLLVMVLEKMIGLDRVFGKGN
jgi:putative spermidine/putrescine transport system permease protein